MELVFAMVTFQKSTTKTDIEHSTHTVVKGGKKHVSYFIL